MKVATWNIGDGSDDAKARGLTRLAFHEADVIGLQEAGDRERMIDHWCKSTGWHAWFGNDPGSTSVPILWNPRTADAVHMDTHPATPPTNTGRLGAGPSMVKAKVWNRVRFESPDADDLVLCGHNPASVWAKQRRQLAERVVGSLADQVEHREDGVGRDRVDVIAVMDGNAEPGDRLWTPLRRLGMHQHTHHPTHGRRTIDLVWTLGCEGHVDVIDMPSDHRAAIFTKRSKP